MALFVYGTLTFPDVLRALLGRVPATEEASVEGWRAVAVPDRSYPVLVSGTGWTHGLVLLNLRQQEWQIIDAYEDSIYQLRGLQLIPAHHQAVGYVSQAGPTSDAPSDAPATEAPAWDRDRFAAEDLGTYLLGCRRWRLREFPTLCGGD
ncbi:gamma-glutamylcyclotransferase family protein [Streptomyces sp. NPDC050658]|uniref:gamma-glutamylcyclotransferase family protein n=1 Tax=unclassified Streptomyces TaxID=2593676 RepID=UPI00343D0D20